MGRFALQPDPRTAHAIYAYLIGAAGSYTLDFGDGTRVATAPPSVPRHVYAGPGAYTLTALGASGAVLATTRLHVRDTLTPTVTITVRSDNLNLWDLVIDDAPDDLLSWYSVRWGNGESTSLAGARPITASHGYRDGTYTVTVTDTFSRRVWRKTITVKAPDQDPNFTFDYPHPTTNPRLVRATCTALQGGKTARLDWGVDGAPRPEFNATGQSADYTYAADGTYIVNAAYTDGSGDGAAWDVPVPMPKKGTKPTSRLIIRKDPFDPLAAWIKWAGSITDYDLHFGDGESTRRLWWQPPVKHHYPSYGRYRVRGVNDLGHEIAEWLELSEPTPPPPRNAPVFEIRRHRDELAPVVRLLLSPADEDGFDHRTVAHDIDWGDGHRQSLPAGTAHVDHEYPKAPYSPEGVTPYEVTVTDSETGKFTKQSAKAWLRIGLDYSPGYNQYSAWYVFGWRLPDTWGPHQLWREGDLVYEGSCNYPENGNHYIARTITDYPPGYGATTLVARDGQVFGMPIFTDPTVEPNHEIDKYPWGKNAYDFAPGTPYLITVKGCCFSRGCCGPPSSVDYEWGDGATETVEFVDSGEGIEAEADLIEYLKLEQGAGEDVTTHGPHPQASHWYTGTGPYTMSIRANGAYTVGWDAVTLGQTQVSGPNGVPGNAMARSLTLVLPHRATPIYVDWGDGTPMVLRYPGGSGQETPTLTHTYAATGAYQITVHAPLQAPKKFTTTIRETKTLAGFSATYTPASQWWGGYSATYRVRNQGTTAATWELSFTLDEPAEVKDVWGAGEQKRSESKQHKKGKPSENTDPALAMYRRDVPTGRGAVYVIKCLQPLKPNESVDIGFRVEAGVNPPPEPRNCSINGGPCTGSQPDPGEDTQPPTQPTDLKVTNTGPRAVGLSWTESSDDTGVKSYEVAVDGDVWQEVPAPAKSGSVTKLEPETTYEIKIRAVDFAGNRSLWSEPVQATTAKETAPVTKPWMAKLAPFVDMGLWPTPQLDTFAEESGLRAFNLGFITAVSATECKAVWAGQATYAVESGWEKTNINSFRSKEGHYPVISFGGETGTELAQAAKDVNEVYAQYKLVIDTYGLGTTPNHVDFDIEGAAQKDQPANERRAAAVARLQQEYPELRVSWTLPVLPEGLTADGLNVLRTAVNAGVRLDLVNIMAMVFYRNEDMGELVQQAMESTHRQLAEFFPGMTAKQRWSKLSVCPMIGQNNDGAIFSLDHADEITDFATSKRLGQITYWEAGRDRNACLSESLYQCTNIPQKSWEFAQRFSPFQDAAGEPEPGDGGGAPQDGGTSDDDGTLPDDETPEGGDTPADGADR